MTTTTCTIGNHADHEYDSFLKRVQERFIANCESGKKPLFTTDAEDLWERYLGSFSDPVERQYHNCHACRHFIQRFGALATLDEQGRVVPALWQEEDAPEEERRAIAAMSKAVRRAKVTGVFLSAERVWGTPATGVWHHLAVTPPSGIVHHVTLQTASQMMAEKREDFKTVMTALNEFTQSVIETALTLLRTDSLYRSEKVLGQAEWLLALHVSRKEAKGAAKANAVWKAVAQAPAGFCHPRSSMIGTLLEDIAAGMAFEDVSRRFADKMHPLRYQRPQAAPTAGAIAAAEKAVEQLGIARSLPRRFARVDEVQALWRPQPVKGKEQGGGVFGHLKPKGKGAEAPSISLPVQTMTWDKFQRTVLPTAERIEFLAPARGSYTALTTAVNADAPPILQWDREEARNPVAWYFWHGGSNASQFSLLSDHFHDVEAVALQPSMWNGGPEHHGAGVLFVIKGARETRQPSACLFPEILRAELHGVRSVIEAYSRNAKLEGMEQPHAAGYMVSKGKNRPWNVTLRVWSGGKSLVYALDRWD